MAHASRELVNSWDSDLSGYFFNLAYVKAYDMLICNRTPGTHHAAIMPLDFPEPFLGAWHRCGNFDSGVYGLGSLVRNIEVEL